MKSNPLQFLFNIALLLLVFLLASCGMDAGAPPMDTPATPAPTETTAPTIEPTKSPNQIAGDLEGLSPERDYVVWGDHLVDTYNNAPKAVRAEDGSWRELDFNKSEDAEVMYSHLVPVDLPYIDTRDMVSGYYGKVLGVQIVYLGDVSWENEEFNGMTVDMAYLLTGMRDGENNLHIVKYGVDAMNTGTPHWFNYSLRTPDGFGNGEVVCKNIEVAIDECLKPGDYFNEPFLIDPNIKVRVYKQKPNEIQGPPENVNEYREITTTLFNQNKEVMMTREEWKQLIEEKWPERVVNIYTVDRLAKLSAPVLDWMSR